VALAVLVCGCVFVSLAGPAVSLHQRTRALQQILGRPGTPAAAARPNVSPIGWPASRAW
jgi:hypothetical protein